jgi:hypothetical protein
MEKTIEFNNIKEFSKSNEVIDSNIQSLKMHFDRDKKKYIVTIEYGKKT